MTALTEAQRLAKYEAWLEVAEYAGARVGGLAQRAIREEAKRRYGPRERAIAKVNDRHWYRVREGATEDAECPFEYTMSGGEVWVFSPIRSEQATPGTMLGDLLANPYKDNA